MPEASRNNEGMEYAAICWASARIALWAKCGVSDRMLVNAINGISGRAGLTAPQEALFKQTIKAMGTFGG